MMKIDLDRKIASLENGIEDPFTLEHHEDARASTPTHSVFLLVLRPLPESRR